MVGLQDLLQCCCLPLLASAILKPPTRLNITSVNFKHNLTWEEPNTERDIFYNVEYEVNFTGEPYSVANCSNITTRHCDVTKIFSNMWAVYRAQVQSFTSTEISNHSYSPEFRPLYTVVGPPNVDVVAAESGINVSISLPASYLWNKDNQRFDSLLEAYPSIDYEIYLEPSTQVPIYIEAVSEESFTKHIPSLSPSTTYCVTVSMISENMDNSVPSPKKCATTTGEQVVKDASYVILVGVGISIFIILPTILCILDRAGYISMKRIFTPKVLESLPNSRSVLHEPSHLTPLISVLPTEFTQPQENEHIYENHPRQMARAPYIAHNHTMGNMFPQEALDQARGLSSNDDPTGEHHTGLILGSTGAVFSGDPRVQSMVSIYDLISTTHPAPIPTSERNMEDPSAGNLRSLRPDMANGFDGSSLRYNSIGIDLNSVSLRDSADLGGVTPTSIKENISTDTHAVDISQFKMLCSVLSADTPDMDDHGSENIEHGDGGGDLIAASNYFKR